MLKVFLTLIIIISASVIVYKMGLINHPFIDKPAPVVVTKPPEEPTEKVQRGITKTEVFRWTDKEGKVHFSDREVAFNESEAEKITVSTETTEFSKTPKIKSVYIPNRRQTSAATSRSEKCKKLKAKITKEEKRLRRAGRIPSQNKKLSEKRWEAIKGC